MYRSKSTVSDFCFIGIMAAVTAVMAQISIPMPMGVPMTMQTFAVTLAGIILGSRRGALSMLVYLLIGVVGVPVFSNFTGGLPSLVGPTGGFLVSFPIMAYLIGLGIEFKNRLLFVLLLIPTAVLKAILASMLGIQVKQRISLALQTSQNH